MKKINFLLLFTLISGLVQGSFATSILQNQSPFTFPGPDISPSNAPDPNWDTAGCPNYGDLDFTEQLAKVNDEINWVDDTILALRGIPLDGCDPADNARLQKLFARYQQISADTFCLNFIFSNPAALLGAKRRAITLHEEDDLKKLLDRLKVLSQLQSDLFPLLLPPPCGYSTHEDPIRV